jgi:tetratricopeptide (TPR) repeat protein
MHREAERIYLKGAEAAQAGSNYPLVGNLLSSLSYQMTNTGEAPADAVVLARSAAKGAGQEATPATRALLLERVAWAQAKSGRGEEALRTLADVDDTYALHQPGDPDPVWVYWFNRAEIDVMAGRCYTELAMPLRAVPLLTTAIDSYDTQYAREVVLYQSWLAEAYVQADEVEQAVAIAHKAVDLSSGVHSARTNERLSIVRQRLEPFKSMHAVQELNEHADMIRAADERSARG